jgi:hypothetical protein
MPSPPVLRSCGSIYCAVEQKLRSRSLLLTTKTEQNTIAATASIGFSSHAMPRWIAATL